MGVSILEPCYLELRDSILLTTNLNSLENGGHDRRFRPSSVTRRARNTRREVKHATQLWRDLLDFNVATQSSLSSEPTMRKMSSNADVGCNPTKKQWVWKKCLIVD